MPKAARCGSGSRPATPFLGLAPFLRMSLAGADLVQIHGDMLARAEHHPDDLDLWMNLATVMLCLRQRDLGLKIQAYALAKKRVYHLAAAEQPAKLRLLLLMTPGDLAANTPLDCLLENSDIDVEVYYLSPDKAHGNPWAAPVPEHEVLFVAIGESGASRGLLRALEQPLARWPKPVVNAPQRIRAMERAAASRLLQHAPGLCVPPTVHASRADLLAVAAGKAQLRGLFEGCDFPAILRPVGSHAGCDLAKIDGPGEMAAYLSAIAGTQFFLSRFVDYSGADGLFRKYRIVLIGGVPFACHMAVSSNWMVHYANAGMYDDADKRAEEARFMAHFDDFSGRHRLALEAICRRAKLDYLCIDCAETRDGRLLVFEIDPAMVVHGMDPEPLFAYKLPHMRKVQSAFRDFLFGLAGAPIANAAQVGQQTAGAYAGEPV